MTQFGMAPSGDRFNWLRDALTEEHNLTTTDLVNGQVPDDADLLLLVSPENLVAKQLFAVDQFLMRGGTVVIATSPFETDSSQGTLAIRQHQSGLDEWLGHHGIELKPQLVLDPQNAAFPIPVDREIGGFVVRETQMVNYPYFVDIRSNGMAQENGITTGLNQVTLTWPSPINVDQEKNKTRQVIRLLESSNEAWTSNNLNIQPDYNTHAQYGFSVGEEQDKQLLSVLVEGRFDSFFKDKPSPLTVVEEADADADIDGIATDETEQNEQEETEPEPAISRLIDRSPESSRIILFASNTFLADDILNLATTGLGTRYLNPVELLENSVDWSLEDRDLLEIRGRAQFSRTLNPQVHETQVFWEYLNYGLALLGLLLIWLIRWQIIKQTRLRYAVILGTAE